MRIRLTYNAPVVLSFALAAGAVLLVGLYVNPQFVQEYFVSGGGNWSEPMTWVRFFTYSLGSSSILNFLGNITLFLLIGPVLEEQYGSKWMTAIILISAVTVAVANDYFGGNALMGTGGIDYCFIMILAMSCIRPREIPVSFLLVAAAYIGQSVYIASQTAASASQVPIFTGLACGFLFGIILNRSSL